MAAVTLITNKICYEAIIKCFIKRKFRTNTNFFFRLAISPLSPAKTFSIKNLFCLIAPPAYASAQKRFSFDGSCKNSSNIFPQNSLQPFTKGNSYKCSFLFVSNCSDSICKGQQGFAYDVLSEHAGHDGKKCSTKYFTLELLNIERLRLKCRYENGCQSLVPDSCFRLLSIIRRSKKYFQ